MHTLPSPLPGSSLLRGLALVSLLAATACQRDEGLRANKEWAPATQSQLSEGHPPTAGAEAMPGGAVPAGVPLAWTTPKGWSLTPGSGMRVATLKPGLGNTEVSVISLAGAAGGELSNVNRWRGQLGLAPVEEKALPALRQTVKAKAGAVNVYDFTGDGGKSRMVVGLLPDPNGATWFLKLTGDADPVAKAKPGFVTLLQSLRLETQKL